MKRNLSIILLCLCAGILLWGCDKNTANQQETEFQDEGDEQVSSEYQNMFQMTSEQRMEDYEYLWNTLRDSYGFWGVLERSGIDAEAIYKDYLEYLQENDNDVDFFIAINSALYRMGSAGHLSLIDPESYEEFRTIYAKIPGRQVWDQAINQKTTADQYKKLLEFIRATEEEDEIDNWAESQAERNLDYFILPGGQIAYLRISSFDMSVYESDKKEIFEFYQQASGCEHLIIDITANSGGGESYWEDLLVAPNITETLTAKQYAMLSDSVNNHPYLEAAIPAAERYPIDQLLLDNVRDEDKAFATHYVEVEHTVHPASSEPAFSGGIWVLTSPYVYSASESFALFCKDTGFAKLVGTNTGGDGIGIDPVYVVLPNSGLLVRYSMLVGLNHDGSINEEAGTAPDILTASAEQALPAALKAITLETIE